MHADAGETRFDTDRIRLLRQRAASGLDEDIAPLAAALDDHGLVLDGRGQHGAASGLYTESMTLFTALDGRRPGTYQRDMAIVARNHARSQWAANRQFPAIDSMREARRLWLAAAGSDPACRLLAAQAADRLATMLAATAQHEEACEVASACVAEATDLLADGGPVTARFLAGTIDHLAIRLAAVGRYEEALRASTAALAQFRDLAADGAPDTTRELAVALLIRGRILIDSSRVHEAVPVLQECADAARRLIDGGPARALQAADLLGATAALLQPAIGYRGVRRMVRRSWRIRQDYLRAVDTDRRTAFAVRLLLVGAPATAVAGAASWFLTIPSGNAFIDAITLPVSVGLVSLFAWWAVHAQRRASRYHGRLPGAVDTALAALLAVAWTAPQLAEMRWYGGADPIDWFTGVFGSVYTFVYCLVQIRSLGKPELRAADLMPDVTDWGVPDDVAKQFDETTAR